mmetsp:Transcript_9416/g.12323  ORF Transcript_9416/g.12323 Transcript_9416/m.12323 type:complete len:360 (+) Transcript_9416:24-1103(+)
MEEPETRSLQQREATTTISEEDPLLSSESKDDPELYLNQDGDKVSSENLESEISYRSSKRPSNDSILVRETKEGNFFGTKENDRMWLNQDIWGFSLSVFLWVILLYAEGVFVYFTFVVEEFRELNGVIYSILIALTLITHLRVMLTDPGSVPKDAEPLVKKRHPLPGSQVEVICGRCDAFRPPRAHHCMTCGRCIVRMDHHCAWVNNCVGVKNQKHFIAFLLYLHITSLYCIIFMTYHIIICKHRWCNDFGDTAWYMLWSITVMSFFAALFTFFMLLSQVHAMATGLGAVDRLMRKHYTKFSTQRALDQILVHPLNFKDICGIEPFLLWGCPTTVHFEDEQQTLGYKSAKIEKAMIKRV